MCSFNKILIAVFLTGSFLWAEDLNTTLPAAGLLNPNEPVFDVTFDNDQNNDADDIVSKIKVEVDKVLTEIDKIYTFSPRVTKTAQCETDANNNEYCPLELMPCDKTYTYTDGSSEEFNNTFIIYGGSACPDGYTYDPSEKECINGTTSITDEEKEQFQRMAISIAMLWGYRSGTLYDANMNVIRTYTFLSNSSGIINWSSDTWSGSSMATSGGWSGTTGIWYYSWSSDGFNGTWQEKLNYTGWFEETVTGTWKTGEWSGTLSGNRYLITTIGKVYDDKGNEIFESVTGKDAFGNTILLGIKILSYPSSVNIVDVNCSDGYQVNDEGTCYKTITYDYYTYTCPTGYEPIITGGDCNATNLDDLIDTNGDGIPDSCNSPTPPENNCEAVTYTCPADANQKCVYVNNQWQCSPFKCNEDNMCGFAFCANTDADTNNTDWVDRTIYFNNFKAIDTEECKDAICDLTHYYISSCGEESCPQGFGVFEKDDKCYKYVCPSDTIYSESDDECYKYVCPDGYTDIGDDKCEKQ